MSCSKKGEQLLLSPQTWGGSALKSYREDIVFAQPSINRTCYSLLHSRSPRVASQVLDDWSRDDTYEEGTFHLYVKDKHPELWAEVLSEMTKHRLLR